ncbi:riboflavin-binding protein-like [Rhinatrema bivittatum]|uniref:riboflavin-binding protein-like n=1 Tax=Rhinatrema bivittatum TaxID=194408 RepID=UPI00112DAE64|nr:riboflavin-binding protein-like [Rhinatrema bivittatum]XP_029474450.1 riboflavin-binding protein-like [Rhinatrema bivittatum]
MQMLLAFTTLALLATVTCHHHLRCLQGKYHKPSASAEPDMKECRLYSAASCCYANFTEKLTPSPMVKIDNYYWNKCGNLSARCESYLKQLECFYQCSPHAAHWMHPNSSESMQDVPLCQSFCDSWLEACSNDLTCVYKWLTDWTIDEDGNHCRNACIPFKEMYKNGTDLCQNAWEDSFKVSNTTGRCLMLTEKDEVVVNTMTDEEEPSSQGEKPMPAETGKEEDS